MTIKSFFISVLCVFCTTVNIKAQSFVQRQLEFERVRAAKANAEKTILKFFKDSGLSGVKYIYWRAFKKEQILQLWAADSSSSKYKLVKTYEVCRGSGDLGPKRKIGDLQVPEGLYYISRYNPYSNFHLSMQISYPNESDAILGDKSNLGNEIFIHGACASVGCLPMTDSAVDEIYWITVLAQSYQGSSVKIPIDIFPCKFTKKNWEYLKTNYPRKSLIDFWSNLEGGYTFFEKHRIPPGLWIDQRGLYNFVYPQNFHIYDTNH